MTVNGLLAVSKEGELEGLDSTSMAGTAYPEHIGAGSSAPTHSGSGIVAPAAAE